MFGSFLGHNALLLGFARLIGLHRVRTTAERALLPRQHGHNAARTCGPADDKKPRRWGKSTGANRGIRKDHQLGRASFISLAAGPRCFCEKSHTGACANTEQATATGPDQRWPLCHRTRDRGPVVIDWMSLVPFKRPSARRLSGGGRGDRVARTLIGFSLAAGRPAHDQVDSHRAAASSQWMRLSISLTRIAIRQHSSARTR